MLMKPCPHKDCYNYSHCRHTRIHIKYFACDVACGNRLHICKEDRLKSILKLLGEWCHLGKSTHTKGKDIKC